jgi:hypothetical protein
LHRFIRGFFEFSGSLQKNRCYRSKHFRYGFT